MTAVGVCRRPGCSSTWSSTSPSRVVDVRPASVAPFDPPPPPHPASRPEREPAQRNRGDHATTAAPRRCPHCCPNGTPPGERSTIHRAGPGGFERPVRSAPGGPVAPLADTDVVIVEAVRIAARDAATAGSRRSIRPTSSARCRSRRSSDRGSTRARSARSSAGCVSQVGEQTFNIARTAWLSAGMPLEVAATTVDAQCGSSQQATNLATTLVQGGGRRRRAELRRREHEPGAARRRGARRVRAPDPEVVLRPLRGHVAVRGRGAHRGQVGRHPRGLRPLRPRVADRAPSAAWAEGRFEREVKPVDAPDVDEEGKPTGTDAHGHARRRVCARRRSRRSRAQARRAARTACTPRARRRRSPTAPPRCC